MRFHNRLIARTLAAALALTVALAGLPAQAATAIYTITAKKVNIREQPDTGAPIRAVLRQGSELTLIEAAPDGWLHVSAAGVEGYVSADYAALSAVISSGGALVATVAADKLNVRAEPSPSGKSLGLARRGAELTVSALTGGWLQVDYNGAAGYVSAEYVRLSAPGSGTQTAAAPAASPTPAPAQVPVSDTAPVLLRKGDKGEAVKALQQDLILLGYLTGEADGLYGSGTKSAVRAFQAAAGLAADGAAGEKTVAAIRNAVAAVNTAAALKEGSRGDAVRALQQKLIALGRLSGSADGIYGAGTKSAVAAFQAANGLTADGIAGAATLAALNAAYQKEGTINNGTITAPSSVNNDGAVVTPASPATAYPTLKYGDSGDGVAALQTRLQALGYFKGTVGGNFGTLTQTAVRAFQTAASLKADGVAGADTWTALFAANAPTAAASTLKEGDQSDAVKNMQTRLRELGYLDSRADGDFGAKTKAALQAFQQAAGLSADGMAGPNTLAALYAESAPRAGAPTATPAPDTSVAPSNPSAGATPVVSGGIRDTDYATAEKMIEMAKQYLGCTYIYAHQAPPYFDCSGLTYYIYKQFGYTLKRTAYMQGYDDTYPKISRIADLQPGDLIYFNTNTTDGDLCDHAAIYIGDGSFIHASSSAGKVVINSITSGYYKEHFSWGRRVLNQQ